MASMLMFATPTGLRDLCADLDCCARLLPVETKKSRFRERETYCSLSGCVVRTAGAGISQRAHGRREQ